VTTRKAGTKAAPRPHVVVDLNDLTAAEVEEVEELLDAPLQSLMDPNARQGKGMRVLAYIVSKRDNPDFTLEDAGKLRVFFQVSDVPPTDESA
jgi:hypothetical protein